MNRLSSLLVVGLARNVQQTITSEVARIEKVATQFYSEVDFHVVESDSIDKTVEVLKEISLMKKNFAFESLGDLEIEIPERIARLRYCRNRYIKAYREKSKTYSEVMVVDFDIRNTKFHFASMGNVLKFELDWSGLFANQTGNYFDIFALRARDWCTQDCFSEVNSHLARGLSREEAKELAIWQKMRRIKPDSEPIAVDSAFGGMAIYRSWVFDQLDYSIDSTPIQEGESEHIALNYKVKQSGGQLYIVPRFTNFGWSPHNLASYKAFRRLDKITKRKKLMYLRSLVRTLLN